MTDLEKVEQLVILKLRTRLQPEDFLAQLYLVIVDRASKAEATERQTVYYGQQEAKFPIVRAQTINGVLVYDRPVGGEELIRGWFNDNREYYVHPSDTIYLSNITWP